LNHPVDISNDVMTVMNKFERIIREGSNVDCIDKWLATCQSTVPLRTWTIAEKSSRREAAAEPLHIRGDESNKAVDRRLSTGHRGGLSHRRPVAYRRRRRRRQRRLHGGRPHVTMSVWRTDAFQRCCFSCCSWVACALSLRRNATRWFDRLVTSASACSSLPAALLWYIVVIPRK